MAAPERGHPRQSFSSLRRARSCANFNRMDTDMITPEVQTRSQTRTLGPLMEVTHDIAAHRIVMVNVVFVGAPGASDWVLVDAGLPFSAPSILRAAAERYGPDSRPRAIILTHAHFDHVGALKTLAKTWDVPVYAHALEMPFVTGRSAYPPPDPTVGGGMMARLSPLYPRGPWNVGRRVQPLPGDGSVPHLPGWRWVPTPGHSPGQVALFREADRALIAGDAFVTTKQESATAVLTQRPELHGPPMYYTIDWMQAWESVRRLAELRPSVAVTGHGVPMMGAMLENGLAALAQHFDELAMPRDGRYVREPARWDETGITYVPPAVSDPVPKIAAAAVLGLGAFLVLNKLTKRD
jgi:glyoxylase-like metal-dependent hydrolase (beta-lactamase superfamily II)